MKNKKIIEIDLDLYKLIVQHSEYIDEPANQVLKRLLKLTKYIANETTLNTSKDIDGLNIKGTFLPNGLKLRKYSRGKLFEAEVKNGLIEFNKKKYSSPSGAAVDAANGSTNGWRFWEFYDSLTGKWKILESLRNK